MFFVYPENYSIVRADVKVYRYNFSSKGVLADDVENVFVFAMCKSIVNHKTVSPDFLMHCVVDMMRTDPAKDPDITQVMGFIRELVGCWQILDACQVDAEKLLENAVTNSGEPLPEVEDYVKSRNEDGARIDAMNGDLNDLTPEKVLKIERGQR